MGCAAVLLDPTGNTAPGNEMGQICEERQTNCSKKKVDWVSQVLADASAVSPGPG